MYMCECKRFKIGVDKFEIETINKNTRFFNRIAQKKGVEKNNTFNKLKLTINAYVLVRRKQLVFFFP